MNNRGQGPWWGMDDNCECGGRGHRGGRGRGGYRGGDDGLFGPRGPFGPDGPFGQGGIFGPGGIFGAEPGRGRGGRGGRRRRGDVRLAILALLSEEPMNGYQIIQTLDERTGGLWKPSPGAVYPALAQLTDEGLVAQITDEGRQAYRLTEAGQQAAATIDTKPWEAIRERAEAHLPEGVPALWVAYGQLAAAAKAVMASGDADLIDQAVATLAETRRKLFGLLADEPDADDD